MGKHISSEQVQMIKSIATEGLTYKEIAARVGCSTPTVGRILKSTRVSTLAKMARTHEGGQATPEHTVSFWKQRCSKLEDFILKMIINL